MYLRWIASELSPPGIRTVRREAEAWDSSRERRLSRTKRLCGDPGVPKTEPWKHKKLRVGKRKRPNTCSVETRNEFVIELLSSFILRQRFRQRSRIEKNSTISSHYVRKHAILRHLHYSGVRYSASSGVMQIDACTSSNSKMCERQSASACFIFGKVCGDRENAGPSRKGER